MSVTVLNPASLHNPVGFGYSHTASVPAGAALVMVAGQYASGPDGAVTSASFQEQVRKALGNLELALAAHGLALGHVVQLRTYVVQHDFEKLGTIAAAVKDAWGESPPAHTVLGVASLATPDILFEVEAIATRPPEA